MQEAGAPRQSCAVGSVKSMIGHAKCAAGIGGLIKTVKALQCKTLPPTLVDKPNPNINFAESALYLNTQPRPWVHDENRPRRAGVSSFGFGGTNVHVALEEYRGDFLRQSPPALDHWPLELLAWKAATRSELAAALESCSAALEEGAKPELRELAAALSRRGQADDGARVAIVASSLEDLHSKLASALSIVRGNDAHAIDPRGVYFSASPSAAPAKIAFLFPGQGSQYPNMLAQLAMNFPTVRQALDHTQHVLAGNLKQPLGRYVYPPSPFSEQDEEQCRQALAATNVAQPAIGATSVAIGQLLAELGVAPDVVGGHSYGELTALWSAGVISTDDLLKLSLDRGELMRAAAREKGAGGMVAIDGDKRTAETLAQGLADINVANVNAPGQTVLSGAEAGLEQLLRRAQAEKIRARRLPVACAFHSPLVAGANEPFARKLYEVPFGAPDKPVFSNVTAAAYPGNPDAVRELLSRHLTSPVEFVGQIEAMYATGARIFIEAGPNNVLTGLAGRILQGKPHLAVAMDVAGRDGLEQLAHALGQLFAYGAPLRLDRLFAPRQIPSLDLSRLAEYRGEVRYSPSTWLVNGVRSRPHNAPEPELLGTRSASARDSRPSKPVVQPSSATPPEMISVSRASHENRAMSQPMSNSSPVAAVPSTAVSPNSEPAEHNLSDDAAQVMLSFQTVMAKFLDAQRAIMLSYLQGGGDESELPLELSAGGAAKFPDFAAPHAPATSASEPSPAARATETTAIVASADERSAGNGKPATDAEPTRAIPAAIAAEANGDDEGHNWDLDKIGAQLLDLLSERTGYPKEMLDLDLDLEADLGIDSIKRVEILGGLTESLNGDGANLESRLDLEKLTSRRSLRGILSYLDEVLFSEPTSGVVAAPERLQLTHSNVAATPGDRLRVIQRGLVKLIEAPLPPAVAPMIPSGAVVLTDDGRGVARQIAERLADFGQPTVIIAMAVDHEHNGDGYSADLTDPGAVARLVDRLRGEFGSIGGLVHALPLAPVDEPANLYQRAQRDVKSLYLLARELEPDLRQAGQGGKAFLLAATALGGDLGYGQRELASPALAAHGGILGFVKCVGLEWPEVLVRAVDLDSSRPAAEMADRLLRELSDPNGPMEVGYRDAIRITWEPVAAPLQTTDERARTLLPEDATVLVTGGARGITAEIAAALGERYRPNLILVGRSPLPPDEETAEMASLSEPAAIKQALIARFDANGAKASPSEIEATYRDLVRDREIRANLSRLRATGARSSITASTFAIAQRSQP